MPTPSRSLPLALSFALVLGGCTKHVDIDVVRESIRTEMAKQRLPAATITCPAKREVRAGDQFDCTVIPEIGGKVHVQVTQTNDQGLMDWKVTRSEGVYDMDQGEAVIARDWLAPGVTPVVHCGDGWIVADVGDSIDCTATDPDGTKHAVVFTIKDAGGGMSWSVR